MPISPKIIKFWFILATGLSIGLAAGWDFILRNAVGEMGADERRLLTASIPAAMWGIRWTSALLIVGNVGNLVMLALGFWSTGREIAGPGLTEQSFHTHERFKGIFDTTPLGMALVDMNGKWLNVNKSLCEIFGYSNRGDARHGHTAAYPPR